MLLMLMAGTVKLDSSVKYCALNPHATTEPCHSQLPLLQTPLGPQVSVLNSKSPLEAGIYFSLYFIFVAQDLAAVHIIRMSVIARCL